MRRLVSLRGRILRFEHIHGLWIWEVVVIVARIVEINDAGKGKAGNDRSMVMQYEGGGLSRLAEPGIDTYSASRAIVPSEMVLELDGGQHVWRAWVDAE
jgi:hypothetical protein